MLPFLRLPFLAFLAGLFLVLSQGRVAAQTLPGTAASGDHHSLCIHADGTLWATGDNFFGQLGTGNTTSTATWVQVGTATDWVQVSAGGIYSLGLKANGTVYAWGTNAHGQLGINSTAAYVPTPTAVAGGPYTQVMAGETHALALRADGKAYAWGDNSNGELGNPTNAGTTISNPSPLPVSGGPYSQLAPSFFYTLALTPSGALYAWGSNQYGQFGNGTTGPARASNPVPARVGTAVYTQVAAGPVHCMALRADGTLWAWGTNAGGQLGIATNNGTYIAVTTPTLVDGGMYTQVAAGGAVTLALKPNGTLWAWGGNQYGQLGNSTGVGTQNGYRTPTQVGTRVYARLNSWDSNHVLAVQADGTLWAWGKNADGELGTGASTAPVSTPTAVGTALVTRSTAVGGAFGLALRGDGALLAWGAGANGQLGDGTATPRRTPVRVGTDQDWVQVAAGNLHALALKADGTLWAWGENTSGQVGSGTAARYNSPVAVGGGGRYVAVAAGSNFSVALRADGTAWSWGDNRNGQLGDGTAVSRPAPVQVAGTGLYTQVAAGTAHALALRADGTADAWGFNQYGELGNGSLTPRFTPTPVGGSSAFVQVAAGNAYSLARLATGALLAWGNNEYGRLGDGTTTTRPLPVAVSGPGLYTQVAAGYDQSAARQAAGTIYTWGNNANGEAGLGSALASVAIPTQEATNGTTWTSLATGSSAAVTLARTPSAQYVASTGYNAEGQLGDGTTTTAYRFDRLLSLVALQPQPLPVLAAATGAAALVLAPNPARGVVQVPGLPTTSVLAVYDVLGKLVRPAAPATTTLNVAGLPAGVYLVRAVAADGTARTARLVVE